MSSRNFLFSRASALLIALVLAFSFAPSSIDAEDLSDPSQFTNIVAVGHTVLRPTGNSGVGGTVTFEQDSTSNFVRVTVQLNGTRRDEGYSLRIHRYGMIGETGVAGPHVIPDGGAICDVGVVWRFNTTSNTTDTSTTDVVVSKIFKLTGATSIIGRSVVLHNPADGCSPESTYISSGAIGRGFVKPEDLATHDGASQAEQSIQTIGEARIYTPTSDISIGTLHFTNVWENGILVVRINGTVTLPGVSANDKRGWHIHQFGDISAAGNSGGHFTTNIAQGHGLPPTSTRHAGDLGNVTANENGVFVIDTTVGTELISLHDVTNGILGRTITFHQFADNNGGFGDRHAYGVIGLSSFTSTTPEVAPTTSAPTTTTSPPTSTSPPTTTSAPTAETTTTPPTTTSAPTEGTTTAPPTDATPTPTTTVPPATTQPPSTIPPPTEITFTNVVAVGHAVLRAKEGGAYKGYVTFEQSGTDGLVRVNVTLSGVTRRLEGYALHVHQYGVIDAAGGHWNPTGAPHGCNGVNATRHYGDVGVVWRDNEANPTTDVLFSELLDLGAVNGTVNSIIGRGVVLHNGTDPCQPNSTFGAYISSGVIGRGFVKLPEEAPRNGASQHTFPRNITATARIYNNAANGVQVALGEVDFSNVLDASAPNGLRVRINGTVTLPGVTAGETRGWHIHEFGDISTSQTSGGHFMTIANSLHALPPTNPRHAGDLGNVTANANGVFVIDTTFGTELISLHDVTNGILGRTITFHQFADNNGGFGDRHAYGVIGLASKITDPEGNNPTVPSTPTTTSAPTNTSTPTNTTATTTTTPPTSTPTPTVAPITPRPNTTASPPTTPSPQAYPPTGAVAPNLLQPQYASIYIFLDRPTIDALSPDDLIAAADTWAIRAASAIGISSTRVRARIITKASGQTSNTFVQFDVAGAPNQDLENLMEILQIQLIGSDTVFSRDSQGGSIGSVASFRTPEIFPRTFYFAATICADGTFRAAAECQGSTTSPPVTPTFPPTTSEKWTDTYRIYILIICVVLGGSVLVILLMYCIYRYRSTDTVFSSHSTYVARETFDATEMDTFQPAAVPEKKDEVVVVQVV